MSSLGDAVERKLAEARENQQNANGAALQLRQTRAHAADLVASELRGLATYLGTKMRPRQLELSPKRGWLNSIGRSPSGFLWNRNYSSMERCLELLLPSGEAWTYRWFNAGSTTYEIKNIHAELQKEYGLGLFGYSFAVPSWPGDFVVEPLVGKEDPRLPQVPISEAMASIAVQFIERNQQSNATSG